MHERELTGAEPETTNNRMELLAAAEALEALTEPCKVDLHTDSAYLANAFNDGWIDGWKARGWTTSKKKPVLNQDLWRRLDVQNRRHTVRWVKVKGHAGIPLNERADDLAVGAVERLRIELGME